MLLHGPPGTGTQFTGFTGTKVQTLTQKALLGCGRYSVYWLYWYKSTNTDADGAGKTMLAPDSMLAKAVSASKAASKEHASQLVKQLVKQVVKQLVRALVSAQQLGCS
jgi:hypothetical protein